MADLMPEDEPTILGLNRREFIASAGLGTAGAATGLSYFWSKESLGPPDEKEKISVGFIGVGSRGGALLRTMLTIPPEWVDIVALADVNPAAVEARRGDIQAKRGPDTQIFETGDYRELLARPEVNAVVIATPHFMHGPMAIDALEAGKHVYCEKAMAFTIGECIDIYNLVKKKEKKQVFQVGHQRHYSQIYDKVRWMVYAGEIGNVTAVRAQWNRNYDEIRPCPDPRMERLVNWRWYSEYSGGLMTEFASHQIDVANMVLGTPATEAEPARIVYPHSVCGMGGFDYPPYQKQKGRDSSDNVHVIFTYKVPFRKWKRGEYVEDKGRKRRVWDNGEEYAVRFTYTSIMTNALLGPSEMILGDEGAIEVSLGGGDFWKEPTALTNPINLAEGTNPDSIHQKKILKTGSSVSAVKKGIREPDEEITIKKDPKDWKEYIGTIIGEHSPQETLRALDSFLDDIRKCNAGETYHVKADVAVGLASAVAANMGNMAIREGRTVRWDEFPGLPRNDFTKEG